MGKFTVAKKMSDPTELQRAILNTVAQIPPGRVATYGQIAAYSGAPGAARAVGRTMRMLPKETELPWHRVLNARGEISIPHQGAITQRERLVAEGVVFLKGRVPLRGYQWKP